ncbi:MAG TPA: efflux RND transporter periplasmic adaptor subunit [Polyangiaceae bacterium]|nr:efflux RND transporter periplasmic adaptor subunit [Polyangiaceae bacterium]
MPRLESCPVAPIPRRRLVSTQAGPSYVALMLSATLAACGGQSATKQGGPPPPVEVGVVTLQAQPVKLTTELPGRTLAYETSEVRPQVSGIIRARLFKEGQQVEKGQTLYQIDARLYRAAAAQARANLASAKAMDEAARIKSERYGELAREQVVSQQDLTDAKAAAQQAAAAIQQSQAALETARINLQFTEVPAPISGRIGRSLVTTGALVTSGQAEALATIQRLDPMFVDMQESSASLLAMRRSLAKGGAPPASADVKLILEDGSEYSETGTLQFAEATVDPSTGSVALRAKFDNPDGLLLPGMYVRAVIVQSEQASAILAPQPGVSRDPKGNATALVVGQDEKVERRTLELARTVDDQWLVNTGLAAGDRLIVEGTDKVKPGQAVKAVAVNEPAGVRTGSVAPAESPEGAGSSGVR